MNRLGPRLTIALLGFAISCGDVTPIAGGTGGGGRGGTAGSSVAGAGGASGGSGTGGVSGSGGASGTAGGTGGDSDGGSPDGPSDGSPGNDGSGDGTVQCGTSCPARTWDLDGNPATGVCGCEYACNKISNADPID